jgi:antitoxin component YwqK of YwqJK toxin-antitoxin module
MDILKLVRELDFPQSEYVVIGGAAMVVRKIKQTRDIDILVSKKLLDELKKSEAWQHHPRIIASEEAGLVNKDGTIELYPSIASNTITFESLKSNEEIIEGVPFANPEDLIKIKSFYARGKDLKDIELIKKYLEPRG